MECEIHAPADSLNVAISRGEHIGEDPEKEKEACW